MENVLELKYKIYEKIRDDKNITSEISNTKKIINSLMQNNKETLKYCNKKIEEEKNEVEEALKGEHFHKNMTKREILVNEISQYLYWQTIIAVANKIPYKEFNEEEKIKEILNRVDLIKINEKEAITVNEIAIHDIEQMKQKEYLKEII